MALCFLAGFLCGAAAMFAMVLYLADQALTR
jgi:hypothetical protein